MTVAALPRIAAGLHELASSYDVVLSDVWGVVHDGRQHFPAACDALMRFRAGGGVVVLMTNAPRPCGPVIKQLDGLRVPHDAYDAIATSGDVTLSLITARGASPLHYIGPERDLAIFAAIAEAGGDTPPLVALADADYVVCSGLFHEHETPDDYADTLARMRERDLLMVSANPDLVVHVGDRLVYCAGALAAAYEAIGGQVLQAGKPHRPIYDRALQLAAAARGDRLLDERRVLAIGDAMRTDIEGAGRRGLDALFVTSGIHRDELHPADAQGRRRALDQAAYAQFLDGSSFPPVAALLELIW